MKAKRPAPFKPGLVRGQLPRTPLREATTVEIVYGPYNPTRPILDYPSHAETPNEKSKRQLSKIIRPNVINRAVVKLDLLLGDWIL
jgi:hypothetical protein